MNIRLVLVAAAALPLAGCMRAQIDESREQDTRITATESVVVLAGLAMMVLPGPGVLTIALGLAILSLEFELPRSWLARLKARGVELRHRFAEARARRDHR